MGDEKIKKPRGNHFANCTPEQLREFQAKGRAKSMETRRRKREMRETMEMLLGMSIKSGKLADIKNIKAFPELQDKNISVLEAMTVKMIQKALKGDLQAFTMIRDTIGEKPVDKCEIKDTTPVIITGENDLSE